MASLKRVLEGLPPFTFLRDAHSIRPVCQILKEDGENDPGQYLRTASEPVKIHTLIDLDPEPEPCFEEVFVDHPVKAVMVRLSEDAKAWFAAHVDYACSRAAAEASIASRYVVEVPLDVMQSEALVALFTIALAKDRGQRSEFPEQKEMQRYLGQQICAALKQHQDDTRRDAQGVIDNAAHCLRYAAKAMAGLRDEMASLLKPETRMTETQLRNGASVVMTRVEATLQCVTARKDAHDPPKAIPQLVAAPTARGRRRRSSALCV